MTCSSCKYLNSSDENHGAVSGCKYYCNKCKCYVSGNTDKCNNYEKSYRSSYLCNKIYEDGENYYDNTRPLYIYVIILIIMIVMAIICNL